MTRLTPAERRELGEAVLSRLESEMRAAYQSRRYCQTRAASYGGGMWGELAAEHRQTFRVLYGIRRKARGDVEFDRAIPPMTFSRAGVRPLDPFTEWAYGTDNGWGAGEGVEASRG